jgi:Ni/Co efflux regulator RcnB
MGNPALDLKRRHAMKKSTLISALAIAAAATASLALPATASASSFQRDEVRVVHGVHQRETHVLRVHDVDRRYIERHRAYRNPGHSRWAPSRDYHDRGHHYGQHDKYRYDYRPVQRERHHHDDDLRLRIFYDFHL